MSRGGRVSRNSAQIVWRYKTSLCSSPEDPRISSPRAAKDSLGSARHALSRCEEPNLTCRPTDRQHRLQEKKVDLQGRSPAHPCLRLPASFRRAVPAVARDYVDKEIAPPAPIPSSSAAKPIATQRWPCRGRHQGPLGRFIALFVAFRTPKSHVSVIPKTRTAESSVVICNYTLPKRTRSLFACASQMVRLFFCSFCCSVFCCSASALLLLS